MQVLLKRKKCEVIKIERFLSGGVRGRWTFIQEYFGFETDISCVVSVHAKDTCEEKVTSKM